MDGEVTMPSMPSIAALNELFAWPWLLAALPLPLLARWLSPVSRASGAALRALTRERFIEWMAK
jgi:hypothetical protein